MNIYVDFDDCLCETARAFTQLVAKLFGKEVPYEAMRDFNLQKAFSLSDDEYETLLVKGHEPDILLGFSETDKASDTINSWLAKGHDVSVITGRPYSSYEASREWLDRHNLKGVRLFCLDKYKRQDRAAAGEGFLTVDDYRKMKFDAAVEDSPLAFRFFDHMPDLKVCVFDRPWNANTPLPGSNYRRFGSWESIKKSLL